jgi:chemotaxis signal transduction protein
MIEEGDRAVLTARARALAREMPTPDLAERISVVPFALGGGAYAVEILLVREVVEAGSIAPVPGARHEFLGVTTYRGEMLGVIDLRVALGLAGRPAGAPRLVIIGERGPVLGLLADAVEDPIDVATASLLPSPGGHRIVRGMTADARLVLDGTALLAGSGGAG